MQPFSSKNFQSSSTCFCYIWALLFSYRKKTGWRDAYFFKESLPSGFSSILVYLFPIYSHFRRAFPTSQNTIDYLLIYFRPTVLLNETSAISTVDRRTRDLLLLLPFSTSHKDCIVKLFILPCFLQPKANLRRRSNIHNWSYTACHIQFIIYSICMK